MGGGFGIAVEAGALMSFRHVWKIDPLADFLVDHTLTGESANSKLQEVVSRWNQFVVSLWAWKDQARFALRFLARDGRIEIFLEAQSEVEEIRQSLAVDISVLLKAFAISDSEASNPESAERHASQWLLPEMAVVGVSQLQSTGLWSLSAKYLNNDEIKKRMSYVKPQDWLHPSVLYPWWAPGGPFLVPMESLIAQNWHCCITIVLKPTRLSDPELTWLKFLSQEAQSQGERNLQQVTTSAAQRVVDPGAELAGRMYMANLRRLLDKPFLVGAYCAAANGRQDVARSLAGMLQSIAYEVPFDQPQQEDQRLPSGAEVHQDPSQNAVRATAYRDLRIAADEEHTLDRLPFLADARGAATMFRLPVNVRGGIPGIRVRQRPPDFRPGPRVDKPPAGTIKLGSLQQGGLACIPIRDLTKHVLITGFTGSGKTVTVLNILHQLWVDHQIPFLVIESAKKEYRGLLGVPAFSQGPRPLRVFTVGNESCSPFRLNPFELLPGVRIDVHIGRLQTCFEAVLPPIGPLTSMISEALHDVYEQRGWRVNHDVGPEIGEILPLPFPTILDFYSRMEKLVPERGYQGEVRQNVQAAVLGRIRPLTLGARGKLLEGDSNQRVGSKRPSSSFSQLMLNPSILELDDLNLDDKSLVTMFLLTFLREHRSRNKSGDGSLVHLTAVEEAHNILENVSSKDGNENSSDTRFKAVQAFSNMLSEIRALGEGLMIIDQSPEKLAPDALRNTNLLLAHQLRYTEDREAIAKTMIMDDEQRDYLGTLEPGHSALFMTGLQKATFIKAPLYYSDNKTDEKRAECPGNGYREFSDSEVEKVMHDVTIRYRSGPFGDGCQSCPVQCEYRKVVLQSIAGGYELGKFNTHLVAYLRDKSVKTSEYYESIMPIINMVIRKSELNGTDTALWCVYMHMLYSSRESFKQPVNFSETMRESFLNGTKALRI